VTGLVLLAAGESARMGRPKQLLKLEGRTLLRRAAEEALASGCWPIVTVLGAFADRLRKEVADLGVTVVTHRRWAEGLGSQSAPVSMRSSVGRTKDPGSRGPDGL
jgi:molybdenum cofactor cytidylyltransferase